MRITGFIYFISVIKSAVNSNNSLVTIHDQLDGCQDAAVSRE